MLKRSDRYAQAVWPVEASVADLARPTGPTGGSDRSKQSPSNGLTGTQTGLTGASSVSGSSSKAKNKTRPSFKKILAKYDKEGNAQKQKERPNKVKDAKSTFTSGKQSDSQPCQDSCAAMSYSKLIAPWFWSYPGYFTPLDYSRMYMQPYYIQYPSIYPSLPHKDRLTITWLERSLIAARRVRRA